MEMIELGYDYVNKVLTVTVSDGSSRDYFDSETYLADWPDRGADCIAIGWVAASPV